MLAWQLNAKFEYAPALVTEIEVVFTALSPTTTRVDFEHRDLEKIGAATAKEMDGGWGQILDLYVGAASK